MLATDPNTTVAIAKTAHFNGPKSVTALSGKALKSVAATKLSLLNLTMDN